jgi:SAM-dependent methyltransferase
VACESCGALYPKTSGGALDLRLRAPIKRQLSLEIGSSWHPGTEHDFRPLTPNSSPQVDFTHTEAPYHMTSALMSYFPRAESTDSLALDLGCGEVIHRGICEQAGFRYVGLDYAAPAAPLLGDAHALPFADASFEFVLSVAVLEHLQHPIIATREVARVLKPGGAFIGTVAFLEPFHSNSIYHHSHLGLYNSLQAAGFDIEHIAPRRRWDGLTALATMGLFPVMPDWLTRTIIWPIHAAHRLYWRLGRLRTARATEELRVLSTTGALVFVARRAAPS